MSRKFKWCDTEWVCEMEGGRIIHPDYPWYYYNQSDVVVNNNNEIELYMSNSPRDVKYWDGNVYKPTIGCGLMRTVNSFLYGTLQAEIKLPKGCNLWPSFWMVGNGKWPDSGEIDIMEAWSNHKGSYFKYLLPSWNVTNNIHYSIDGVHKTTGSKGVSVFKLLKDPSENIIRYECMRRPNLVEFRVNGKLIRSYDWTVLKYIVNCPMKVIFNVWPSNESCSLQEPMIIKNFNYKTL